VLTNPQSSFPAPLAVLEHCFLHKASHLEYTTNTALNCTGASSSLILWDDAGSCRIHRWSGRSSCKGLTWMAVTSATFLWYILGAQDMVSCLESHEVGEEVTGALIYRWPRQFSLVVFCHYDDSSGPSARFWRPQCSVQVSHHWHHFSTLLLMCSYCSSTVRHIFRVLLTFRCPPKDPPSSLSTSFTFLHGRINQAVLGCLTSWTQVALQHSASHNQGVPLSP
jgi:hypothetical protein